MEGKSERKEGAERDGRVVAKIGILRVEREGNGGEERSD